MTYCWRRPAFCASRGLTPSQVSVNLTAVSHLCLGCSLTWSGRWHAMWLEREQDPILVSLSLEPVQLWAASRHVHLACRSVIVDLLCCRACAACGQAGWAAGRCRHGDRG